MDIAAPGSQAGVIRNGPTITNQLTFTSGGALTMTLTLNISDDTFALENIESYLTQISNSLSIPNVDIAAPATIEISDDDGNTK